VSVTRVPPTVVIPGHREAMSPESITTIGSMDSGQPLRGFRNDEVYSCVTRVTSCIHARG